MNPPPLTRAEYRQLQWAQSQAVGMLGAYTGGPGEGEYEFQLALLDLVMAKLKNTFPKRKKKKP